MAREKAPDTRIQRAGNGHSYYLDGEKVPGVTTIIGDGVPKPALVNWGAQMTSQFVVAGLTVARDGNGNLRIVADELVAAALEMNRQSNYPERINTAVPLDRLALEKILTKQPRYQDKDRAGNRGTEVHGFGEKLAQGLEVDVPDELVGHVDSYVQFLNEWDPRGALLERVIINRFRRYMGKCDMIAEFDALPDWIAERIGKDSGTGLLDIKTGRSGIYSETILQTEAYASGESMIVGYNGRDCVEAPLPAIDFCGAIWVRADGYDVYLWARSPRAFRVFLYAKEMGEFFKYPDGEGSALMSPALRPPRRSE